MVAAGLAADGRVLLAGDVERAGAVTARTHRTGQRRVRAVVTGIAVLPLGVLRATGWQPGPISLAGAVVRTADVLGLLGRLTVLVGGVLRVGRLAVTRRWVTRLLGDPVDVGGARLPRLPVLVVGRLLADAIDALAALATLTLLADSELSRPVLCLRLLRAGLLLRVHVPNVGGLLARAGVQARAAPLTLAVLSCAVLCLRLLLVSRLLLRGPVLTGAVLGAADLTGRSELYVAGLLAQAVLRAGGVVPTRLVLAPVLSVADLTRPVLRIGGGAAHPVLAPAPLSCPAAYWPGPRYSPEPLYWPPPCC